MTVRTVEGVAHGKLILAGEHAVVYGQPALAFAVSRRMTVRAQTQPGPTTLHTAVRDPRAMAVVRERFGAHGVSVTVETDLPVGRGMGSSAALGVALVRAAHAWHHPDAPPLSATQSFDAAMPIETLFHATPSGLDVAVASHGGIVRYVRGMDGGAPQLRAVPSPTLSFVVLDTGKAGPTSELVAGVAARRPGVDPQLARIGALVDELPATLTDLPALGALLDENHALLQQIGVSTPQLDGLVDLARTHGAYGAKLSGAGGGGVVLALVGDDPTPVLTAAHKAGIQAWHCTTAEATA